MRIYEKAGLKLKYNHLSELTKVVEEAISKIDAKIATHNEEIEALAKQRRELKAALGGDERKPSRRSDNVEERETATT